MCGPEDLPFVGDRGGDMMRWSGDPATGPSAALWFVSNCPLKKGSSTYGDTPDARSAGHAVAGWTGRQSDRGWVDRPRRKEESRRHPSKRGDRRRVALRAAGVRRERRWAMTAPDEKKNRTKDSPEHLRFRGLRTAFPPDTRAKAPAGPFTQRTGSFPPQTKGGRSVSGLPPKDSSRQLPGHDARAEAGLL